MTAADATGGRGPASAPGLAGLIDELRWRGMLHQHSRGLAERLASGAPIKGYNGFDPTGPSLHIGHLVPIFGLLHLQRAGGVPVVVVGGGTAMIGDPSGRSAERLLLSRATVEENLVGIQAQLTKFLDFDGPNGAEVVDNYEWLSSYSLLRFLRDIGKHLTVPYMLAKDSVQIRLDEGLSFTEFSYMLLQAADFLHLYRNGGVELQMGGADQWGNMTAGLELIRKEFGAGDGQDLAFAMSYPLLTNESGSKFGKTAAGTSVWLGPDKTSPFAFYQYWLDADDRDVGKYLRTFTLFDRAKIEGLEAQMAAHPETRVAQKAVAYDLTARVHGDAAARGAVRVSEAAFSKEPIRDPELLAGLFEAIDHFEFTSQDLAGGALRIAIASGAFASNGEARRSIAQGGLSINDERVGAPEDAVPAPIDGRYLVVRIGKKSLRIGRLRG
ncbi:MAG: tyrosine--tRNA ligase [Candidatus Limnocylindrales bacterium]|jgi:tyrosyl-tRNA synthetase